jgi:hypothetical protein
VGASGSSAVGSQPQQHRSQQGLSQQSFSQGGVGSGGGSSLLQSQSQLSQGSLDENLLGLHLLSPQRDQVCSPSSLFVYGDWSCRCESLFLFPLVGLIRGIGWLFCSVDHS